MKISSFRIKSFRTITTEQEIFIDNDLTLVGPNNSGKTNILLAVRAFFSGYENEYQYDPEVDLPYNLKNVKTSITCTFKNDNSPQDIEKFEKLEKLRELLKLQNEPENEFSINVYFNGAKSVYQIYPGVKRPKDKQAHFSMTQKQFISSVLDAFQWYYIPSNKSIEELYEEFVTPFVRKKVVTVLEKYDDEIKSSISSLTDSMNEMLSKNGICEYKTSMEYPGKVMEGFISGLDLYIEDKNSSSIFEKGMGIQAAILLSSFKWITEQEDKKHVLWLIEEPETFMHPSLAEKCSKIIDGLAEISTVVKTTHAINFIPSNVNRVHGISLNKNGNTIVHFYTTHIEATKDIRYSLGVKFSDYFGLSNMNVFLEGETDKLYIEKILKLRINNSFPTLASGKVQFRDFTGVTDLKGFLKANYEIIRKEVALVSLFDGDAAGLRAINDLASFFGKKGGFNSGKDYVLIPHSMAIESLFPDEWIHEAKEYEEAWFEKWILAADQSISFFSIRDKSKKAYMSYMFTKIDSQENYECLNKFVVVLQGIENSLQMQLNKAR